MTDAERCVPGPPTVLDHEAGLVSELWSAARAAWPTVDVHPAVFADYLAERIPAGDDVEQAVRQLRTTELYLACACAHGDPHAIAAFEHHYLAALDPTLAKIAGVTADAIDDIKQRLRYHLFVRDTGTIKIAEFSGRGELRRWLRVLAVREALAITRRRRETPSDTELLEQALSTTDAERDYLKRHYQHEFTSAISEALDELPARDQVLLRQRFVDGLNIDDIGALYRTHRATAARWLARAQDALSHQTRAILMRRLTVSPRELHSILRLVRSGLELSLRLVFARREKRRSS